MTKLADYKKKEKGIGGKNIDKSGFYVKKDDKSPEAQQYFIKFPDNPVELFAELFVGQLIEKLKQNGFIPAEDHESLICAGCIEDSDAKEGRPRYGLIQPRKKIKELCKLMGDEGDRDATREILDSFRYKKELEDHGSKGADIALLISLLFSDYSVHSGNVVRLLDEKGNLTQRVARIDWGAALRDFGYSENASILEPKEYKGFLNIKKITKNYISRYFNISGLFEKISGRADKMARMSRGDLFEKIILEVLSELPQDLLTETQKEEVYKYIGFPGEKIFFGKNLNGSQIESNKKFANNFSRILKSRLNKIKALDSHKKSTEEIVDDYLKHDNTDVLFQLMKRKDIAQYIESYISSFSDQKNTEPLKKAHKLLTYVYMAKWIDKYAREASLYKARGEFEKVEYIYKSAYIKISSLPAIMREASPFYGAFKVIEYIYKEMQEKREKEKKEEKKKEKIILSLDWDDTLILHNKNKSLSKTLLAAMNFSNKNNVPTFINTSRTIFNCLELIRMLLSSQSSEDLDSAKINNVMEYIDQEVCFEPSLREMEREGVSRPIVCSKYDPTAETVMEESKIKKEINKEELVKHILVTELKQDSESVKNIIAELKNKLEGVEEYKNIEDLVNEILNFFVGKKLIEESSKEALFSKLQKGVLKEENLFPRGRMRGGFYYQNMDHVSNYVKSRIISCIQEDKETGKKITREKVGELLKEIRDMQSLIREGSDWKPVEEKKGADSKQKPPLPAISRIEYLLKKEQQLQREEKKQEKGHEKDHQFKWIAHNQGTPEKNIKIIHLDDSIEINKRFGKDNMLNLSLSSKILDEKSNDICICPIPYVNMTKETDEVDTNILSAICESVLPTKEKDGALNDKRDSNLKEKDLNDIEFIIFRLENYAKYRKDESKSWCGAYGFFQNKLGSFTCNEKIEAANELKKHLENLCGKEKKLDNEKITFEPMEGLGKRGEKIKGALLESGSRLNTIVKDINEQLERFQKIFPDKKNIINKISQLITPVDQPLKNISIDSSL